MTEEKKGVKCKFCGSTDVRKIGFIIKSMPYQKVQRYQCKSCGRTFSEESASLIFSHVVEKEGGERVSEKRLKITKLETEHPQQKLRLRRIDDFFRFLAEHQNEPLDKLKLQYSYISGLALKRLNEYLQVLEALRKIAIREKISEYGATEEYVEILEGQENEHTTN
jgi:transcriptional regulator NrdR family protein